MKFFQSFRITGVANSTEYDGGLKSTDVEGKRLVAVHLELSAHAGTDDNDVQGWHERSKVFDIPEKMFPTETAAAVAMPAAGTKMQKVPVDIDIPAGEAFKVAIKCAATAVNVRGAYEYEIIT